MFGDNRDRKVRELEKENIALKTELKSLKNIKWKPVVGEECYNLHLNVCTYEDNKNGYQKIKFSNDDNNRYTFDDMRYDSGFIVKTEEEAIKIVKEIREVLKLNNTI